MSKWLTFKTFVHERNYQSDHMCYIQLIKGSRSEGGPRRGLVNELDLEHCHQRCCVVVQYMCSVATDRDREEKDQEKEHKTYYFLKLRVKQI